MFQDKTIIFYVNAFILASLSALLFLSCDERKMDEESLTFLMNQINKDTQQTGEVGKSNEDIIDGGTCAYAYIPGMARITSIVDADPGDYNCQKNPVKITFDFYPSDTLAKKNYLFQNHSDVNQELTIGSGINPPGDYISAKGVYEGRVLRCVRAEIVNGTCTPVIFQFPDIDFSDYGKNCWQ